jgi:hypothetical protein
MGRTMSDSALYGKAIFSGYFGGWIIVIATIGVFVWMIGNTYNI